MATATDIIIKLNLKGEVKPSATVQAVLLIGHSMESGFRVLDSGERVPKNVIERMIVTLNNETVLVADMGIGISASPYFSFPVTLPANLQGAKLVISWADDRGAQGKLERVLA